jgi:hypothetical protein
MRQLDLLLNLHQDFLKKVTNKTPAIKPPICPHHATPPPEDGKTWVTVPANSCSKNHHSKKKTAGTSINHGIIMIGMNVRILAFGNNTKYAPMTPAIAPDAPMTGIEDRGLK